MNKPTQIIEAKTFTCKYDEKEDRILLAINYQDITQRIDFWITRAFLIKLLPYFFEYTGTHENKSDQIKSPVNKTDEGTFVLTQKKPILLDSVDFKDIDGGKQIVFKSLENQVFTGAVFDQNTLNSFASMLTNAVPKYEWGISSI